MGSRCYEQLWVVVDMTDSGSRAQGSKYYKQLKFLDDMNDSELCA